MSAVRKNQPVVGAIIQARLGSSRFPGKVLQPLAGRPLLGHVIERLRQCRKLDRIILATSTAPADQALLKFAREQGIEGFAGSENDVLNRFLGAADQFHLDVVVRICSDSPMIDWKTIDRMIKKVIKNNADYSICDESLRHACDGFEVVTTPALRRVAQISDRPSDHEHVTIYIRQHPRKFAVIYEPVPKLLQGEYRMSVDVAADLELMRRIYDALYRPGRPVDLREAVRYLKGHPEVRSLNAHVRQKPPEAFTRRVILFLKPASLTGEPGRRLGNLTRHLAENLHCVVTLAAPVPPADLAEFSARGFRIAPLPWPKGPLEAEMRQALQTSQAEVVIHDEGALSYKFLVELRRRKLTCLPLETPPEKIDRAVAKHYK